MLKSTGSLFEKGFQELKVNNKSDHKEVYMEIF